MQPLFRTEDDISVSFLELESEKNTLLDLFESVAEEQFWRPGRQLHAYPGASVQFGLFVDNTLIGGLLLVVGNQDEGLPCLTVWPELHLENRRNVADIALLALDKRHRGQRRLFWLLCIEMWRYCHQHQIETLWAEVTPANLQLYRRLGWPLQVGGPLRSHWGELCYPCWMSTAGVAEVMAQKASTSEAYRTLLAQAYREEPLSPLQTRAVCHSPI